MKTKNTIISTLLCIFSISRASADIISIHSPETIEYGVYNNHKVIVVENGAKEFRCIDGDNISINDGSYIPFDYFDNVRVGYYYSISYLNKGVNTIRQLYKGDTEYLIYGMYEDATITYLTNQNNLICPVNKYIEHSPDVKIEYWEYSKDNGISWERINYQELIYEANEPQECTVMYRNVSTEGTYSYILTVNYVDPVPESIKTNIDELTKTVDESATLSLDISDHNYTYQWMLNGENINGATGSTYHIDKVKMKDAGEYTCLVSNGPSSATSSAAKLTVNKCPQTIDFPEFGTVTYGCEPITLPDVTDKGLPLSYQSTNNSVATVSENILTVVAPGETNIIASQAGNDDYLNASLTRTLRVNKIAQTISFDKIPEKTYGDLPFDLPETSDKGLKISYTV